MTSARRIRTRLCAVAIALSIVRAATADPPRSARAEPDRSARTLALLRARAEAVCQPQPNFAALAEHLAESFVVATGTPFPGETNQTRRAAYLRALQAPQPQKTCSIAMVLATADRGLVIKRFDLETTLPGAARPSRLSYLQLDQLRLDARGDLLRTVFWYPEIHISAQLGDRDAPYDPEAAQPVEPPAPAVFSAATFTAAEDANRELAARLFRALDRRDGAAAAACFAPTSVEHPFDLPAQRFASREARAAAFDRWLGPRDPSKLAVRDLWAAGEWVVANIAHSYRAARDLPDLPGTAGKDVLTYSLWVMHVREGSITEAWTASSRRLEWLQLGVFGVNEFNERFARLVEQLRAAPPRPRPRRR
ncbi:MAG: nuclear transport factor 2 family protein [Kofleriaceae bacterium]